MPNDYDLFKMLKNKEVVMVFFPPQISKKQFFLFHCPEEDNTDRAVADVERLVEIAYVAAMYSDCHVQSMEQPLLLNLENCIDSQMVKL